MSYMGNEPPDIGAYGVQSFDGGGTSFTLSKPSTTATVLLFIDGVRQTPVDAYSVSGVTLTTTATTPSGTDNVTVQYLGDVVDFGEPSDDSVTSAKIVDGAIVNADVNASAAINATKIADGSVTSTEFQYINSLSSNAQTQITNTVTVANAALPKSGGTMSGATVFADQLSSRFIAKDYAETVHAGGNTSTSVTLDETNGNVQTFTMTGNCTFTMPSGSGLQSGTSITLILTQDGTGSRTGAFTSVKWAGGTAPTLTTTATTGVDIITFYTFNGGSSPVWYGFAAGLDMQ